MKHLANIILALLPPTRWFRFKRVLLRGLGIDVGAGTNVCGDVRFFGGGKISIGRECWIGLGAQFYTTSGTTIVVGNRCDIAPEVAFVCGSHEIGSEPRRAGRGVGSSIDIGDGCWIGFGATLLGGCSVENGSVVGARSLLRGDRYGPSVLVVGSPAKVIKHLPVGPD